MQMTRFALLAVVALTVSTASVQALEVKRRTEVPGEPQKIWSFAGDLCAIKDWHPLVADCQETRQGDDTFRVVTLKDGGKIKEKLTEKGISPIGEAFRCKAPRCHTSMNWPHNCEWGNCVTGRSIRPPHTSWSDAPVGLLELDRGGVHSRRI
jgi:hypothetical protein